MKAYVSITISACVGEVDSQAQALEKLNEIEDYIKNNLPDWNIDESEIILDNEINQT